jgi:hypothetical protein
MANAPVRLIFNSDATSILMFQLIKLLYHEKNIHCYSGITAIAYK